MDDSDEAEDGGVSAEFFAQFAAQGVFEAVVVVLGVATWEYPVGGRAGPRSLDDEDGVLRGENDGADTCLRSQKLTT